MRIKIFLAVMALIWITLLTRIYYFTIKSNTYYEELSARNSNKTEIIFPSRGIIYDRNHQPLAINRLGFSIKLAPKLSSAKNEAILDAKIAKLASYFSQYTSVEKLKAAYLRSDSAYNHDYIKVIDFLPYEAILPYFSALNLDDYIDVEPASGREYPNKTIAAHILGFVSKISPDDKATPELLKAVGFIGKDGLEKYYNAELQGEPGYKIYKVNALNEVVGEVEYKEPSANHDLTTTIDIRLQQKMSELFEDRSGAAIIMDATNGEILAAGSFPEYDINMFVRGLSHQEWDELSVSLSKPLTNRLIRGLYPPGSTVKPAVAQALLANGVSPTDSVSDEGFVELGGRKFRDWKKEGHGSVDMRKAIQESCDVYFYKMGMKVGIDPIAVMLKNLGLGEKTGVDAQGELAGVVPNTEWKKKKYKENWYTGETLVTVIGQGQMLVTPLQLAKMTSSIATGVSVTPHFAKNIGDRAITAYQAKPLAIPQDRQKTLPVRAGMYDAANTPGGTAYSVLSALPIKIAAKTGTAQVSVISQSDAKRTEEKDLDYYKRSHAWLITYAPYENPKYVIIVLFEHGGHGGTEGGPVAAELYKYMVKLGYFKDSNTTSK
ncbi:MAG: penicillin-binding protein 2 [Pseudomonadota bacterium]|jgi:penicillin-binding protein 2